MKKYILLLVLTAISGYVISQVKTVKVPPNKDTVQVTTTTTTNVVPAQVTTNTVVTTATIPTNPGPGPGPDPDPGGSVDVSFQPETNYYERPFAGVENWQGQNFSPIGNGNRLDFYDRLSWTQLEGSNRGQYTWTRLDNAINQAISSRQRYSFGVMTCIPGGADPNNGPVNYDGSNSLYPLYLHNLMQQEQVKDRVLGGTWVPNWNSENYLGRMEALNTAMASHINTSSFNGVRYKDVVNYIDIRFMGSYGEWHHAGIVDNVTQYPSGMRPVVSTYKRIINSVLTAFPDNQCVMLLATLDANFFNNTMTPPEVTWYALNARNNAGLIGIRADQRGSAQWVSLDNYVHRYQELNNRSFGNSGPFSNTINERWKFAPLVGEPEHNNDNPNLSTLVAQAKLYHYSSTGNGNYTRSSQADASMRDAAAISGYRIGITIGRVAYTTTSLSVSLNWQNTALATCYENWNTTFDLLNSSGVVVWSAVSSFKAKLFLPAVQPTGVSEVFPVSLSSGAYTLKLTVKDPTGYRAPMPLNIKGRGSDGSYIVTSFALQ